MIVFIEVRLSGDVVELRFYKKHRGNTLSLEQKNSVNVCRERLTGKFRVTKFFHWLH